MNAAIYNEIDPFAAQWLENLIAAGHVAPGRVDRRSIADLKPADIAGSGQRHFFAGIGGWSYGCRLAGVPDDADIWTGSCPCQGLSDAGKRLGALDPRHLWPAWFELIRECRPATIFGEQVASRLGLDWLDLVRSDLEGCGYAFGASDLCAASVGAPHIRQRLYFTAQLMGDARSARGRRNARTVSRSEGEGEGEGRGPRRVGDEPINAGTADAVADAVADANDIARSLQLSQRQPQRANAQARGRGKVVGMADTAQFGRQASDDQLRPWQHESNIARRCESDALGNADAVGYHRAIEGSRSGGGGEA